MTHDHLEQGEADVSRPAYVADVVRESQLSSTAFHKRHCMMLPPIFGIKNPCLNTPEHR